MSKWRCRECMDISYTGTFCLHCDSTFWKNTYRRYWLQIFVPSVLLVIVGVVLQPLGYHNISWVLWGLGVIGLVVSISNSLFWGNKVIKRKFDHIEDIEGVR